MQLPPVSPAPVVDSQTWRTLSVGHRRRNNIKSTGVYNYEHNYNKLNAPKGTFIEAISGSLIRGSGGTSSIQ